MNQNKLLHMAESFAFDEDVISEARYGENTDNGRRNTLSSVQFKNKVAKALKEAGYNVAIKAGHGFFSGFISNGDKFAYVNITDEGKFLYRTAKNDKDFSGGQNRFAKTVEEMVSGVSQILGKVSAPVSESKTSPNANEMYAIVETKSGYVIFAVTESDSHTMWDLRKGQIKAGEKPSEDFIYGLNIVKSGKRSDMANEAERLAGEESNEELSWKMIKRELHEGTEGTHPDIKQKPNGKWGVWSDKHDKFWPADYDTEEMAHKALEAYHAKNESMEDFEAILSEKYDDDGEPVDHMVGKNSVSGRWLVRVNFADEGQSKNRLVSQVDYVYFSKGLASQEGKRIADAGKDKVKVSGSFKDLKVEKVTVLQAWAKNGSLDLRKGQKVIDELPVAGQEAPASQKPNDEGTKSKSEPASQNPNDEGTKSEKKSFTESLSISASSLID